MTEIHDHVIDNRDTYRHDHVGGNVPHAHASGDVPHDLNLGLFNKQEGIKRVLKGKASEWSIKARAWIKNLPSGVRFTSEDMTKTIGMPPSPNAVGAVMSGAAQSGLIKRLYPLHAERANQNSATIWVWERTDKA